MDGLGVVMGIGVHVCEGCGAVYDTIGAYLNCADSHGGTCYPIPHGGTHGADPCRHCEQNTGEDEGPDWCQEHDR